MKFKLTLRDKLAGTIETQVVEAADEAEARDSADGSNIQIVNCRPLRLIGEKIPKAAKPVYVSIKKLRARHERDLSNKQMHLGKYSPEAIAKEQAKLQAELAAEQAEFDKQFTEWNGDSDGSVGCD